MLNKNEGKYLINVIIITAFAEKIIQVRRV
jgi:hypothetical protein